MRLVSRLAPPAAIAALAATALAVSAGTAHAEPKLCLHNAHSVSTWVSDAATWAAVGAWDKFQESMDRAYESAGGYCAPGQQPDPHYPVDMEWPESS